MSSAHFSVPMKFRELRERAGLSLDELAKAMGYKGPSSIQRYESPEYTKDTVSIELAGKLAKALLGKGSDKAITANEVWALARPDLRAGRTPIVSSYDPDGPEDAPVDQQMTIGSETGLRGVPEGGSAQLDATGGMGGGGLTIVSEGVPGRRGMTFAAEHVRDYWRLPPSLLIALGLAAQDIAILPVQGDSMQPTLDEGDVVFIDTRHRWPSPPGLYAVLDEIGGIVVKRIEVSSEPGAEQQTISVISDNPRHKPREWRAEDLFIVGRVLRKFGTVN